MKTKITSVLMTMVLITLATTGGLAAAELITKLNAVPNAFNSETSTTTINYELNQASGGNYTVNVRNQDDVSVRIYENNPIDGLTGNLVWDGKDTSGAAVVDGAYTIGFSTSVNLSDDYQFGGMWCSPGSGTGQLFYPWGIAIDSKGNYYITDYANDRIQKFDTNWNFIKMWGTRGIGSGQFFHPTGIAVDKDDNIYVSEFDNNRIQKFDSEGNFINFWGIRGDLPGQFKNPMGIVVNKNNELLVADYGNARIQKFSSAGIFISSFGTPGTGGGQFQAPVGIAVDQDANIYVTDIINKRIHIFDSNGNYKSGWILDNTFPQGVAVDSNGNIFISGYYDANISKYDKSGNLLKRWGSSGTGEMQLMGPSGIAIDSSNNVFVVERLNHRVQKFILPVAEETRECSVIVDNIVPEIVISDIPEYTKNIVVPVITITDDNLSNHEITMNGNVFVSGTQVTDDGNYKINVSATDSASNVFEKSVEFSIDTLNPEIIVTGVESEGIYNTSMKALINIVDANLMTSEVILNDEVYVSGTEILEDGEYVLKVGAVDKVGNSSNLTLDFSIDKTAPVIVVTGIENEKEYNTLVTPIIEIQDNGLFSQEVTVNSEEYISGNAIDEEGEYILLVKANDTSGNISEMEISFVIDKTAPVITVAGVNNGAYYNGTVSPAVEVTGSESYTIMLNGAEFISGSSVNYSGEYKLLITAIDTAGNESELQVGFVIDNIDPIISASGVVDNGIYSSAVVPEINIVESHIDTKTVLLNNIPYISGTEINQDGNYKLNVVVTDKAQNISYFEIGFTIDTIVPQINISGALEGSIYNSSVSPIIEITDANPGTSEILLNGETFVSGSELSVEGSYKLNVSAVDTAGNKNTTTLSFQVDKTVPAINISGVSEGGVYIDPVTPIIDVTDANLETSEILLNGEAFISGTVIEKEGEYELTVSAEDGAGNKSDVALKFTFENPIQNSTISAAHQADPFFPGYEFSEIKNDILEIVFSISGEAGQVENLSIVILDDVGNVIRNLLDGVTRTNGNHTVFWDGKDAAGNLVSDGEYIYRINGNDIVAVVTATVQKLTAVKIQKELVNISRILVLSSSEYRDGCFMHSVLESNKIFHKVVYSCTDFVKNMRTGIYNLYIINSGETNLGGKDSMTMRKELLVRVQNGDGLIGIHFNAIGVNPFRFDGLMGKNKNIYGVKFLGTLPKNSYTLNIIDSEIATSGMTQTSVNKIKVVELKDGKSSGYVLAKRKGKESSCPVIVTNNFYKGKTVLFTMDLNNSSKNSPEMWKEIIENGIGHIVNEGSSRILPVEITLTGSSIPIKFDFTEKLGNVDGNYISCLSSGDGVLSGNEVDWSFTLEASEVKKLVLILQIPEILDLTSGIEFSNVSEINFYKHDETRILYDRMTQKFIFDSSETSQWPTVSSTVAISDIEGEEDSEILDSDYDGIPDKWEIDNGLDPFSSNDISEDPDNDGISNYEEFINSTDPMVDDRTGDSATVCKIIDVMPLNQNTQWYFENSDGEEMIYIINGIEIINGDSYSRIFVLKNKKLDHVKYYRHDSNGLTYGGYFEILKEESNQKIFSQSVVLAGSEIIYGNQERTSVEMGDTVIDYASEFKKDSSISGEFKLEINWTGEGKLSMQFDVSEVGPLKIIDDGITWSRIENSNIFNLYPVLKKYKLVSFNMSDDDFATIKDNSGMIFFNSEKSKDYDLEVEFPESASLKFDISFEKEVVRYVFASKPELDTFGKDGLPEVANFEDSELYSIKCLDNKGVEVSVASSVGITCKSENSLEQYEVFKYVPLLSKWEKLSATLSADSTEIGISPDEMCTFILVK